MSESGAIAATSSESLKENYSDILDHPPLISDQRLREKLAQRDALDRHFARTSLGFASGVMRRAVLDDRTRMLVQIGQFTIGRNEGHLEDVLRVALAGPVPPRDALEAIFQALIYGGDTVVQSALDTFTRVAAELRILDGLREGQLPLDGREEERDLETEKATWDAESQAHPKFVEFLETYGWQAISTGVRFRGIHHIKILSHWQDLDLDFAQLWESFAYRNMYSRDVLDGKTRVLCTIGDLIVVGATTSVKEHIRSALKEGATPREIMEIILISGVNFGFPTMTAFLRIFEDVIAAEGRLDEIGSPEAHPYDSPQR